MQPPHCNRTTTRDSRQASPSTADLQKHLAKHPHSRDTRKSMDFDPRTPEYLQGLRTSTWYIQDAHIEVTAPHAYALQGLLITPGHPTDEPGGVVRLFAPGQYSGLFITAIRAPSAAALSAERQRLELHLAGVGSASVLPNQMPVASAVTRGAILLPEPGIDLVEADEYRGSTTYPSEPRRAAV